MLAPAPSARGEPSIWYADVAAPHRKPSGKSVLPGMDLRVAGERGRAAYRKPDVAACRSAYRTRRVAMVAGASRRHSPSRPHSWRRSEDSMRHRATALAFVAALSLAFFAAPAPVRGEAPPLIPRQTFFGEPDQNAPQISPDGRLLVWSKRGPDGVMNL